MGAKSGALSKTLERILTNNSTTLVCANSTTGQMVNIVSVLIQMLPPSLKAVSFITAPLGRNYRKERSDSDFRIKLVQDRSFFLSGVGEYVEIGQDYEVTSQKTPESKIASYLIDRFDREGETGVKAVHTRWEQKRVTSGDPRAIIRDLTRELEVVQGKISINSVSEMHHKGQKQEAKLYAEAILKEHKWKDGVELAEIFKVLLEEGSPALIEPDLLLLMRETSSMKPTERFVVYDKVVENLPSFGRELIKRLRKHYGAAFFTQFKDFHFYPALSARLFDADTNESFATISLEALNGSQGDILVFDKNAEYIIEKGRERLGEHFLDLVQVLLRDFPKQKATILSHLKPDDLLPSSVVSRLPQELRLRLLTYAANVIKVFE